MPLNLAFIVEHPALLIPGVVALGVISQLLAQRLRLPSILLLLGAGFAVSPAGLGIYVPGDTLASDELFFALVATAVAIILFEGGLTLKWHELSEIGRPLKLLLTLGALVTWALATLAAVLFLNLSLEVALLLGAILIVTGPTVVGPLLRYVRPTGRVAAIIKWEGILNDPVGALLAVLVLEVIVPTGHGSGSLAIITWGIGATLLVGFGLGIAGAWALTWALERHSIPDHLQGIATLALVLVSFAISNAIQHEAGLFTVTIMGIALANQRRVPVKHIVEFKEHLGVLFISCLFIALAARFTPDKLEHIGLGSALFVAALILIVRPASVFVSFWGSELDWREKLFVSWMAPRGIVACAVATLFSLRLAEHDIAGGEQLEPLMFLVIVGTVMTYGLTAAPLARALGVASAGREGLLIVGAHGWSRELAAAVQRLGAPVRLVDTNLRHVLAAREAGLPADHGNILDEEFFEDLDFAGLGRMLALTPNDEANALAAIQCAEEFGRAGVYQVRQREVAGLTSRPQGRPLFREAVTWSWLDEHFAAGGRILSARLTESFTFKDVQEQHEARAIPLFVWDGERLEICRADHPVAERPGQTLLYLVES